MELRIVGFTSKKFSETENFGFSNIKRGLELNKVVNKIGMSCHNVTTL